MSAQSSSVGIIAGVYGHPDFTRRVSAALIHLGPQLKTCTGVLSESWSSILTSRPSVVIYEIGHSYSDRIHVMLRTQLTQIRERYGNAIYIIVALTDPTRLFFGGDLLFQRDDDLSASGWVDSFIVAPPGLIPSIPSIPEQAAEAVQYAHREQQRRESGKIALPAMAVSGWAQSLADPHSRELWMRWLPRYASYTNENPIVIGQTGTGKTNLAYALHRLSGRKGQFVSITPRDFSSSELVQAELFGAVSGAYTGAVDKWGLVKSAEKGTLFIDELQSIDKDLQGKLITFIENKTYRRVGSAESISADVRFVFASNRSLDDMMSSGVLRDDFAYRLERVQLELTPLNRRRLDISAALGFALAKIRRQRPGALLVYGCNSTAYRLLFSHHWPGNLRQLENTVAQLCERADLSEQQVIDEKIVSGVLEARAQAIAVTPSEVLSIAAVALSQHTVRDSVNSLHRSVETFIELAREYALESCGGDTSRAAQLLTDDPALMALVSDSNTAKRLLKRFALKRDSPHD